MKYEVSLCSVRELLHASAIISVTAVCTANGPLSDSFLSFYDVHCQDTTNTSRIATSSSAQMFTALTLVCLFLSMLSIRTQIRSSHFLVTERKSYQPSSSLALLLNASTASINKCAATCLNRWPCQTATFYRDIRVCSLYNEQHTAGAMVNHSAACVLTKDSESKFTTMLICLEVRQSL